MDAVLPPSTLQYDFMPCTGKSSPYILTDVSFVGIGLNIILTEFVNKAGTASHPSSDVNLFHLQSKIACPTGLYSSPSPFQADAEDLVTDHGNSLQQSSKFTLYMNISTQQLTQRNKYRRLLLGVLRCHVEMGLTIKFSYAIFSVDKKNQLDVTFCILYFSSNSCSTCFGQPCAHHQELTTT